MKFNYKQLILPLNLEYELPDDDPVRLLDSICDELDYSELYKTYDRVWRKYDPKMMFKLIVYGYICGYYSCRDLERACHRNICFMWLLNGSSVPDSATFARFQNERLTSVMEKLFFQFIELLYTMKLRYMYSRHYTTANGYEIENRIYRADGCAHCPLKDKCFSSKRDSKEIKVSLRFLEQRRKSMENITSEQGIKLRVNRSIQVEGAFGVIKQNMGFKRFLTRGKHKTETQFFLLAFAFNVMKLQSRTENGRFNADLFELKNTA